MPPQEETRTNITRSERGTHGTKRDDTPEEAAARSLLAIARSQVEEQIRKLRPQATRRPYEPAADTEPTVEELVCPWCGSANLQYDEMVRESRDIFPLGECGRNPMTMCLSTDNVNYDAEDTDACLWCRDCHEESAVPDEMDIRWI